jgi:hypothetical protein
MGRLGTGTRGAGAVALLAGLLVAARSPAAWSAAVPAPAAMPAKAGVPSHYQPDRFAGRAGRYYRGVWGVEALGVKWVESGDVIRFTYRVIDPAKARVLNDTSVEPALVAPGAGVSLVIPKMENVGPLRQTNAAEAGRAYWMAFSNKGRLVRRGDRVNVEVGAFHADGLVVD